MNVRAFFLLLLLFPAISVAQGFAGLGRDAEGFAVPERGTVLEFPRDHGPHEAFRIEWWYVTANLQDSAGRHYGVQWTLFRSALSPKPANGDPWQSSQMWLGHAAVTTEDEFYHAERWSRGGIGTAGATAMPFAAWIDEWQISGNADLSEIDIRASGTDFAFALSGSAERPIILHGDGGYSVKSTAGQASYYYAQPHFAVSGTVTGPAGEVAVTGRAWLDREWSSQPLSGDQSGWDWFSIHLETGDKFMGFQLRQSKGEPFRSGTWIGIDGQTEPIDDLRITPLDNSTIAGRDIPVEWRIEIPSRGIDMTTKPVNPNSYLTTTFPYWEGPVIATGSHDGIGYLEMTGY